MKNFLVVASTIFFIACTDAGEGSAKSERDTSSIASSNADSQESKEERNKQTAMNSIDGFTQGNVDVVLKDVDKDFVDYGEGSFPPVKGVDSARVGLQSWMNAFSNFKGTDLVAVADGDYVIIYGTWSGTWSKDFMGMKATNKSFKIKDADIFKFNDAGKIIEHRGVQSAKIMAEQVGMKMQ